MKETEDVSVRSLAWDCAQVIETRRDAESIQVDQGRRIEGDRVFLKSEKGGSGMWNRNG